jgi:hypothetical protein
MVESGALSDTTKLPVSILGIDTELNIAEKLVTSIKSNERAHYKLRVIRCI